MSAFQQELQALRTKHDAYIAKWKADGKPVLSYHTPCCQELLQTPAPPLGQQWDSLCTCPKCGELYMKVVNSSRVIAEIPDAEG